MIIETLQLMPARNCSLSDGRLRTTQMKEVTVPRSLKSPQEVARRCDSPFKPTSNSSLIKSHLCIHVPHDQDKRGNCTQFERSPTPWPPSGHLGNLHNSTFGRKTRNEWPLVITRRSRHGNFYRIELQWCWRPLLAGICRNSPNIGKR